MWQFLKWILLSHLLVLTLSPQAMADKLSDSKLADRLSDAELADKLSAAKLLDAKRSYFAGDFEKTDKIIRHMVKQGNAVAQNILGVMYFTGQGVEQDLKEAARLYLLSATQGNAVAQNLSLIHI